MRRDRTPILPLRPAAIGIEPNLTAIIGAPGSGKSTLAHAWFPRPQVVSIDEMRWRISGNAADQDVTPIAVELAHTLLAARLQQKATTAFNALNTNPEHRAVLLDMARNAQMPAHAVILNVPRDLCRARQHQRTRRVPTDVIDTACAAVEALVDNPQVLLREGFTTFTIIEPPYAQFHRLGQHPITGLSILAPANPPPRSETRARRWWNTARRALSAPQSPGDQVLDAQLAAVQAWLPQFFTMGLGPGADISSAQAAQDLLVQLLDYLDYATNPVEIRTVLARLADLPTVLAGLRTASHGSEAVLSNLHAWVDGWPDPDASPSGGDFATARAAILDHLSRAGAAQTTVTEALTAAGDLAGHLAAGTATLIHDHT
ncbi:AAA family ATPase [Nocardia niigatensis]